MASRGEQKIYNTPNQPRNYESSRVSDQRRFEDEAPPTDDDQISMYFRFNCFS